MSTDPVFERLQASHREFLALVETIRPDLHRYCARMTGSVADGEDIVQETLARAYYGISQLAEPPALRPWLFQIAHNRALDHLRRYERRMGRPLEDIEDTLAANDDARADPEGALARDQAVRLAVSRAAGPQRSGRQGGVASRARQAPEARRRRAGAGAAAQPGGRAIRGVVQRA